MSTTAIDYMKTTNQISYDQVKTADQKAAYVFTFLTILFVYSKDPKAVLFWLHEPPSLSLHWLFSVAFTLCTAFSLVCAALAIIPRSKSGGASLYWGTWSGQQSYQIPDPIQDSFVIEEYKTNARNLAHICQMKYRLVNLAFRGTVVTILFHTWLLALGLT